MSQWTHVNAVIRFDGIKGLTPDPDLGKTVSFDDEESKWDACDVPQGSEGSLQYELKEVDDGLRRFVATIWGDLRDYSDMSEIMAYLDRIVEGQMIRSGIAEICIEYGRTIILRHNQSFEEGKWEVVFEKEITDNIGAKDGSVG